MKMEGTVRFERKDHGAKRIAKSLALLDGSSVEIGFPEGAQYKGTEPLRRMGVAQLAIVHELGTQREPKIPARPANRMTYDNNLEIIARRSKALYGKVLRGMPVEKALAELGVWYEGKLKLGYRKGPFRPLARATIEARRRKGRASSVPLHDTKGMVNSITSKVVLKRRRWLLR
jgi:hypothetical protein